MSEKLTEREEKLLKKLQKKKREADKHEKDFWKEVDTRKDEILEHFGVSKLNSYPSQNFTF